LGWVVNVSRNVYATTCMQGVPMPRHPGRAGASQPREIERERKKKRRRTQQQTTQHTMIHTHYTIVVVLVHLPT